MAVLEAVHCFTTVAFTISSQILYQSFIIANQRNNYLPVNAFLDYEQVNRCAVHEE